MRKASLALTAMLLFSASSAFAQECDRDEYAVHQFEQDMNADCEYQQEERGQKMWFCYVRNLSQIYYRFFSTNMPLWPYAQTQANACFSDNSVCTIWYQGHCTCDECVIDHTFD
jgi:hypothetical protein